jgi:hypothetical protein
MNLSDMGTECELSCSEPQSKYCALFSRFGNPNLSLT